VQWVTWRALHQSPCVFEVFQTAFYIYVTILWPKRWYPFAKIIWTKLGPWDFCSMFISHSQNRFLITSVYSCLLHAYSRTITRPNCLCMEVSGRFPCAVSSCWQAPVSLNPPTLFATLEWCWMPNWRCATTFLEQHKPAFSITSAAFYSSVTRSWRHYPVGHSTRLLTSRLLQCRARRFISRYIITVVVSSPCRPSLGD